MSIGDYTDNFGIPLSNFDTSIWIDEDWARWRLLDALIAATDANDIPFVVATGAANAFVAAYSPAQTAYALGQILSFKANNAVSGASTINVNGLGAKALKINGDATDVGDIPDDSYVRVIYNGTDFDIIAPRKPVNANQNVSSGASGATANAATDFYVESAGPTYVELLGPNASTQGYMFSRPALSYAGGIKYDQVNDLLILHVGGNDVWSLNSAGEITATRFTGAVTGEVTGNAATATKLATARTLAFTGQVTGTGSFDGSANYSAALTITPDTVTNAMLVEVATATFKGRTTAGPGNPEDMTAAQAAALLPAVVGDSGAGGTKGLVPAPAAGDTVANKFLKADGTWKLPKPFAHAIINGSTGAIVAGNNIASATIFLEGVYDIVFTAAAPNANYVVTATGRGASDGWLITVDEGTVPTTAGFRVSTRVISDGSLNAPSYIYITVFE